MHYTIADALTVDLVSAAQVARHFSMNYQLVERISVAEPKQLPNCLGGQSISRCTLMPQFIREKKWWTDC